MEDQRSVSMQSCDMQGRVIAECKNETYNASHYNEEK